ncbi:hypothetical protein MES4922_210228 [Mesorhizobium ventifaucium]|uniref:Uncharacterized protein n=1 Tax=Mesorhizobium ventifaucium TaxID=666020 RepID=A0ABM9DRR2_9HYPH|nr:hypothetical protein MES4922_210228 [Mesorhizobium ventifaucium]
MIGCIAQLPFAIEIESIQSTRPKMPCRSGPLALHEKTQIADPRAGAAATRPGHRLRNYAPVVAIDVFEQIVDGVHGSLLPNWIDSKLGLDRADVKQNLNRSNKDAR